MGLNSINIGTCSNINLELKYKHMTSKTFQRFYKTQIQALKNLEDICLGLEDNLDLIILVGNIFAYYKPKNISIQAINFFLQSISENKDDLQRKEVLIVPGPYDMPLQFTNDQLILDLYNGDNRFQSSNILQNTKQNNIHNNIHVLSCSSPWDTFNIESPSYRTTLKGIELEFFTVPNPLIEPNKFTFNITPHSTNSKIIFIQPDMSLFKESEIILEGMLDNLSETDLDYFIYGGIIPPIIDQKKYPFTIITSPPLFISKLSQLSYFQQMDKNNLKNDSEVLNLNHFSIQNLALNGKRTEPHIIKSLKVCDCTFNQEIINISEVPEESRNSYITKKIHEFSGELSITQIKLVGDLNLEEYHKLHLYKFHQTANQIGYYAYFEMLDEINFRDLSDDDTSELSLKNEIKLIIDQSIQKSLQNNNVKDAELYKKVLKRVQEDLSEI